jgi:uncharacterized protein YjbI with pentapeptide repeats
MPSPWSTRPAQRTTRLARRVSVREAFTLFVATEANSAQSGHDHELRTGAGLVGPMSGVTRPVLGGLVVDAAPLGGCFRGGFLSGGCFPGGFLSDGFFRAAVLSGGCFRGGFLSDGCFPGAFLSDGCFPGVVLSGGFFRAAVLLGDCSSGAFGLVNAVLVRLARGLLRGCGWRRLRRGRCRRRRRR